MDAAYTRTFTVLCLISNQFYLSMGNPLGVKGLKGHNVRLPISVPLSLLTCFKVNVIIC